jgi:hypothetical protein
MKEIDNKKSYCSKKRKSGEVCSEQFLFTSVKTPTVLTHLWHCMLQMLIRIICDRNDSGLYYKRVIYYVSSSVALPFVSRQLWSCSGVTYKRNMFTTQATDVTFWLGQSIINVSLSVTHWMIFKRLHCWTELQHWDKINWQNGCLKEC